MLAAPPPAGAGSGGVTSVMQVLLPAMGGLGMVLFLVANGNPVFLLAGVVMLLATLGGAAALVVAQRTGARRQAVQLRERYLGYLEEQREELRAAASVLSAYAARVHPDPLLLPQLVRLPGRLYERRPGDPDFLELRVGVGSVPLALRPGVPPPSSQLEARDPVCVSGPRTLSPPRTARSATSRWYCRWTTTRSPACWDRPARYGTWRGPRCAS